MERSPYIVVCSPVTPWTPAPEQEDRDQEQQPQQPLLPPQQQQATDETEVRFWALAAGYGGGGGRAGEAIRLKIQMVGTRRERGGQDKAKISINFQFGTFDSQLPGLR